jgi:hypothetical protein
MMGAPMSLTLISIWNAEEETDSAMLPIFNRPSPLRLLSFWTEKGHAWAVALGRQLPPQSTADGQKIFIFNEHHDSNGKGITSILNHSC